MTGDVLAFFSGLVAQVWRFFNSWHVPGTNVTPAGWLLFLLSAGVLFRFLSKLGFGRANMDDVIKGGDARGENEN